MLASSKGEPRSAKVPTTREVVGWIEDECTNGKTTSEIARHFHLTRDQAYAVASQAEHERLLVGAIIVLRDGTWITRDDAANKHLGVGPIQWQIPE